MKIEETEFCYALEVTDENYVLCLEDRAGSFINIDTKQAAELVVLLQHYALTGKLPE